MPEDPAHTSAGGTDALPPPERPKWKVRLGAGAGLFLGLVLVLGLAKAMSPYSFEQIIKDQGLDFLFPARAVVFIALAIEAVLGFALVLLVRHRFVLWPTVALILFFLFLTGRHYYLHEHGLIPHEETCGCFGDLIERTPAEAFWQDLFLMLPALLLSFVGRPPKHAPLPRKRMAVVAGLTVGVLIYAATVDPPVSPLKEGVGVADLCHGEGEGEDGRLCFDAVVPELGEGEHVVVLVELEDEAFLAQLDAYNEHADAMEGPQLWVVAPVGDETLDTWLFEKQPLVPVLAAPPAFVRALSESLPRSFGVRDASVTRIWEGLPPLEALSPESPGPDDEGRDVGDDGSDEAEGEGGSEDKEDSSDDG